MSEFDVENVPFTRIPQSVFGLAHKDTLNALASVLLLHEDSNPDNALKAMSVKQREFCAKKLNELKEAITDSQFKK